MSEKFDYDKSDISKIYSEARELPPETMKLWLDTISEGVSNPVETILDLGCGEGRFSAPLARRFGAEVVGIDSSRKMLSVANNRDRTVKQVSYLLGCGEKIPLGDNQVSLVFMSMVYHHLTDLDKTISEIRRVLSSEGYLLIRNTTWEDINRIEFLNFFPRSKQIDLQRMPEESQVISKFRAGGFGLVSCRVMEQVFAQNYLEYFSKICKRGLSALAMIPDEEFEAGLLDFKKYCRQKPVEAKVRESIHLFVFRKAVLT